ncbi:cytochrome P450 [Nocardia jiangsuensis]|uniref:Cytochrome P450 n=1 Tax=Nocardia jiangsuensis TaxID=1691563 RepID=A0ABV8DRD1_9NOCA
MKPQYWFRWFSEHGVPRYAVRAAAKQGDRFAELVGGPTGVSDPYPLIERMRGDGPLQRTRIAWAGFDHDVVRSILRDSRFGVRNPVGFTTPRALQWIKDAAHVPANPVEPPSMLVIDPPEHTRMRKPVASAFTPRAVRKLGDRVEKVTVELLDGLPDDGRTDLIASFASRVPIAIISEMLGFPDSDQDLFLEWGDRMTPLLDIGISWRDYRGAFGAMNVMDGYLRAHIAKLRANPGDDILSTLVSTGDLDDYALAATASLLMGAGFETTVNLIGNGVVQLATHPEQLARLRAEPELWPNAIEEILRIDPPVQTTARTALEDVEVGGVQLRAGATVVVSLAGANRDPAVFTDPDRFDVGRENAREHLTFSNGIHVCLGASLARMEGVFALRSLFERFPDLALDGALRHRQLYTLHGYRALPVRLGHRAPRTVPQPVS